MLRESIGKLIQDLKEYSQNVEMTELERVIWGAALVDKAVKYKTEFESNDGSTAKEILSPNGLLGSNYSKLAVLYIFKKIDKEIFQDCKTIAEIRNAYAHNIPGEELAEQKLKEKILSISALKLDFSELLEYLKTNEISKPALSNVYMAASVAVTLKITGELGEKLYEKEFSEELLNRIKRNKRST